MKRIRWVAIAALAAGCCGVLGWVWLASAMSARTARQNAAVAGNHAQPQALPIVVLEETFHNFGIIEPTESCEYTFYIRNRGRGPLTLKRGPTTCDCTMSVLPAEEVPPGYKVPVKVASKMQEVEGEFSHSASIFTNDPRQERVEFTITGDIRSYVAASPSRIVVPNLCEDAPQTAEAIVYSQVWDGFSISKVEPAREGVTWQITPADAGSLAQLKARSGYRLQVTLPAGLAEGWTSADLKLSLDPAGAAESREFTLGVAGRVPPFVSMHGAKLRPVRTLDLGVLRQGETIEGVVVLALRDRSPLGVERIECRPEFLQVSVEPLKEEAGLYRVRVRVPPDAPPSNYYAKQQGEICIRTDHPKVPELELQVAFAVSSSDQHPR